MLLKHLLLQNFRNYTKSEFEFNKEITLIVGPNTSGKTNILEAISLLSLGKSMRGHQSQDMVRTGLEVGSVRGVFDETTLEAILTCGLVQGVPSQRKKLLVNGVPRRLLDFVGHLKTALFEPEDLELVHASPDRRRNFLDDVLIQVDRTYRQSHSLYDRALRQRNRLLRRMKEERKNLELDYWDSLLIEHGEVITKTRGALIDFLNDQSPKLGEFSLEYDKSTVTPERLNTYASLEREAGQTLIGPQRDDLIFFKGRGESRLVLSIYGSRGEQRMAVLWLKMGELEFLAQEAHDRPLLLLDDIFSELDEEHIGLVSKTIDGQQTILTTSHQELVPKTLLKHTNVIELK